MGATHGSRDIRAKLAHPVIDADGHQLELEPLLLDYLREEGGDELAQLAQTAALKMFGWYQLDDSERRRSRAVRPPWGLQTRRPEDLAACMLPNLFRQRMDGLGIDYAILYPTLGMAYVRQAPTELRSAVCRAVNRYYAETTREHAARLTAAAIIPMTSPAEACAALDHAVTKLGHKVIVIDCAVPRPIPALAHVDVPPPLKRFLTWLDSYGVDSEHDYDPFWARCLELKVSPTAHMAGMWGTRNSPSSYVHNHIGMFGAAGEALCKSLFLAGVTMRFPELQIALLEGGAGWACTLFADLVEHWERRNYNAVRAEYDPARLDHERLVALLREHGGTQVERSLSRPLEESCRGLFTLAGWVARAGWDPLDPALLDEFSRCPIERPEDIRDHFVPNFFFGCEAEDPSIGWALDGRSLPFGARLQVMFGSDIGHWDVLDMDTVLAEAHEAVTEGRITEAGFRELTFDNAVLLHGRRNPDFFRGTAVEHEAAAVLARGAR